MGLYIIGLLAAVASVQSYGVPVGTLGKERVESRPADGGFLVQTPLVQTYLRYIDENGAEQLIGYSYPQPYIGGAGQPQHFDSRAYPEGLSTKLPEKRKQEQAILGLDPSAFSREREEHFRAWCEQRYQALKEEVEKLRAQGRQPSADILAQMQPLAQYLSGASGQERIDEASEMQRARKEHKRIWDDANFKILQTPVELRSISGSSLWQITPIQGVVHEHKIPHLPIVQTLTKSAVSPVVPQQVQLAPTGVVLETPEVMRARAKHLRLYNEIKESVENAGHHVGQAAETRGVKEVSASQAKQTVIGGTAGSSEQALKSKTIQEVSISSTKLSQRENQAAVHTAIKANVGEDATQIGLRSGVDSLALHSQPKAVEDTAEVKRAREEHLKVKSQLESNVVQTQQQQQLHAAADRLPSKGQHTSILTEVQKGQVQQHLRIDEKIKTHGQPNEHSSISKHITDNLATKHLEQIQGHAHKEHLKLIAEDVRDQIQEIKDLEAQGRFLEAERLRETERLRQDKEMLEEELKRDMERSREEEKLMIAEQSKLRQEEDERLKNERRAEEERAAQEGEKNARKENLLKDIKLTGQTQSESYQQIVVASPQSTASAYVLSDQRSTNPFLLRYAALPTYVADVSTYSAAIAQQQQEQQIIPLTNCYRSQSGALVGVVGKDVVVTPAKTKVLTKVGPSIAGPVVADSVVVSAVDNAIQSVATPKLIQGPLFLHHPNEDIYSPTAKEGNIGFGKTLTSESSQIPLSIAVIGQGKSDNTLTELEKAKREHFRAHDIALEQLRLAQLKNPQAEVKH